MQIYNSQAQLNFRGTEYIWWWRDLPGVSPDRLDFGDRKKRSIRMWKYYCFLLLFFLAGIFIEVERHSYCLSNDTSFCLVSIRS